MYRLGLLLFVFLITAAGATAQSIEVSAAQEIFRGSIGETVKASLNFRNKTDKTITLLLRKGISEIGSTQKSYLCIDGNCQDVKSDEGIIKIEPGSTLSNVQVVLEAGLAPGLSVVKYLAYNKSNPSDFIEFDVNFVVEEKLRPALYQSKIITLHELYPNPASDAAFIDYNLTSSNTKVKIVLHNILGNTISEYGLSPHEKKLKIRTDELNPGIYFYTLYINNKGVRTQKLIVNK